MSTLVSLSHLGLGLVAGSLTTLSPCVFPMLPLVVGGALQGHRWGPVAMGLGMTLSFASVGMVVGALAPVLPLDNGLVRIVGAWALLAMALVMRIPTWNARLAQWMQPLADSAHSASRTVQSGSLRGAFTLGGVLGLVWSPCSGPLLGSALALVASEGGWAPGGLVLGMFGLGAALPLVAVAYASRSGFARVRNGLLPRMPAVRNAFAYLLGALGLSILLGWDRQLEAFLVQAMPEGWVNLTVSL